MKPSTSENSTSKVEVSTTAPPDWFLRRRERHAALSQKNLNSDESKSDQHIDAATPPGTSVVNSPEFDSSIDLMNFQTDSRASTVIASDTSLNHDERVAVQNKSANRPIFNSNSADVPAVLIDFTEPAPPRKKEPKIAVPPDQDEEEKTPFQIFQERWLGREALHGYLLSILLHLVIGTVLSLIVFHHEIQEVAFTTVIGSNGEGDSGDGSLDSTSVDVDTSGGQSAEVETDLFSAQSVAALDSFAPGSLEGVTSNGVGPNGGQKNEVGEGDGEGTGNGIGDGLDIGGFQMPEGGKAVRKGSFTVWTVPADPKPGEDYKIIIQVKYKKPGQKLNKSDITGSVRGTDRFRLAISADTTKIVPAASQVVVEIPGAAVRVRDTIKVQSTILRESQTLTIEF